MAMLAERKRKVKWALNPRGKLWSEDSNKFGQKILEKMGWSSGKGLGVNESGITEHIKVAFKNDSQGIGYKQRDDQWTQHEDQFNSLLSSLNGESIVKTELEEPAAGLGFEEKNKETIAKELSGESLEDKSKKSKARVHYKKFTRGKDISKYSEKDLANIFGKKVDDIKSEENKAVVVEKDLHKRAGDNENKDFSFGITTMESKISISDYFKSKMPNKSTNKYVVGSDGVLKAIIPEKNTSDQDLDSFRPSFNLNCDTNDAKEESVKSIKKEEICRYDELDDFRPSFSLNGTESSFIKVEKKSNSETSTEPPEHNIPENNVYKKKKKKSKSEKHSICETSEFKENSKNKDVTVTKENKKQKISSSSEIDNESCNITIDSKPVITSEITHVSEQKSIKKSKKKKKNSQERTLNSNFVTDAVDESIAEITNESFTKKKKKHISKQDNEINGNISEINEIKKTIDHKCSEIDATENSIDIMPENILKRKKNKKNKNKDRDLDQDIAEPILEQTSDIANKKKSKKIKNFKCNEKKEIGDNTDNKSQQNVEESTYIMDGNNTEIISIRTKKKKKRKNNNLEQTEIDSKANSIDNDGDNKSNEAIDETSVRNKNKRKHKENLEENTIDESATESKRQRKIENEGTSEKQSNNQLEKKNITIINNSNFDRSKQSTEKRPPFDKKLFLQRHAERLDRKQLKEKLKRMQAEKGSFIDKNAFAGSNLLKLPGYN